MASAAAAITWHRQGAQVHAAGAALARGHGMPRPSPDVVLLHALNGLAGRHPALDAAMIVLAKYSPVVLAILLVGLWLTWRPRDQRLAFLAGAASLLALGIGQLVGMAFPRPRPYLVHHVLLLVPHAPDTSFPSDHATLAFAVAATLWHLDRRWGIGLLLFGILIGVARVYIGAHYPSDILGGAVLGAVVALAVVVLSRRPAPRRGLDLLFTTLGRMHLAAARDRAA